MFVLDKHQGCYFSEIFWYVITILFFRAFKCPYDIYNLQTIIQEKTTTKKSSTKINKSITSLISQCLRICLALQGTRVWSSVWEDPISLGATKAIHHNYWACAVEPSCLNYLTTEPMHWNYWSPHLEPELRNKRSHHNKRPVHHRKVASTCHN